MKPHIFKSVIYPGVWACCAKVRTDHAGRIYAPAPRALIVYATTPRNAYKRWKEYYYYVGSA